MTGPLRRHIVKDGVCKWAISRVRDIVDDALRQHITAEVNGLIDRQLERRDLSEHDVGR